MIVSLFDENPYPTGTSAQTEEISQHPMEIEQPVKEEPKIEVKQEEK